MIYSDYNKVDFKNNEILYDGEKIDTDAIKYAYISGQYSNWELDNNSYNYITKLVLNNGDEYWLTKSANLKHPKAVMNYVKFITRTSNKTADVKAFGSTLINMEHLDGVNMTKDNQYRVRAIMDDGKKVRITKTASGIVANHYYNKLSKYLDRQKDMDFDMER